MNASISESLAVMQRLGAREFAQTRLASGADAVVRRVARRRVARVAGTGTLAVALVAGTTVGAVGLASRGVSPGVASPSSTSAAPSPVPSAESVTIAIPEGFTTDQIIERVASAMGVSTDEAEAGAMAFAATGLPVEAKGSIEGWLAPATYAVAQDASLESVFAEMAATTVRRLDEAGVAPEDRLRVLTVASLIEREVSRDEDRSKVARVITNRLDAGIPLELDSSVRYVAATLDDGSIYTTAEDRSADSPYNTYVHPGLPPGPIASPGKASIDAAVHPADGTWLYFVTVNLISGETLFATTFEGHLANVEVLRDWIAQNEDWINETT